MAPSTLLRIAALFVLVAVCIVPRSAGAIEPDSPACKREMQETRKKMVDQLALIDSVRNAPDAERCKAYSRAFELVDEIRESFARCELPKARTEAVRDADEVYDASQKAYERACPPRPGMVRVHVTNVEHVTRDKLPKPLASIHSCAGDGTAGMLYANMRFDLGRLIMLGCPGNPNPAEAEMKARNARAELLKDEQAAIYLTRDRDGDDPRRLTFPILKADGSEGVTDMLFGSRTFVGDRLDRISSFWEPAKEGVCRINAVWQVTEGKAKLVLWREATDCGAGSKTEFKIVLDRRDHTSPEPGDELVGRWENTRPGHPGYTLSRKGDDFRLTDRQGGSIEGKYADGRLSFDTPKGLLAVEYFKSKDSLTIGGQVYRRVK